MATTVSRKQINNLRRLQEHIKTVPQKFIDMGRFRSMSEDGHRWSVDFVSKNDCGTCGCLLGHAPLSPHRNLAPIREDFSYDIIDGRVGVNFSEYCERVFGIPRHSKEWYKLFSSKRSARKDHIDSRMSNMISKLTKNPEIMPTY